MPPHTNTKHKPKSCGCDACRAGAATKTGNYYRKTEERASRHEVNKLLRQGRFEEVLEPLYGTYTD